MDDNHIIARDVRHVYKGGKVALDNVNLEIGTGLFGLLGTNGAGKSTLMRIICTLLQPTSGQVLVNGLDVVSERRRVRPLIGYLSQEFGAWRGCRVGEVLDTLAQLSGMVDNNARSARIAEVLESVGLSKVADRKVKALSGGMVRRLGVAQALVHQPRILVVDEPTVGLDPEERLRFRQLMSELSRDRIILLSTHIVADLGSGCNELALISHGSVKYKGSPVELINRAKGKVVEVNIPAARELEVSDQLEIVARVAKGDQLNIRGVIKDQRAPLPENSDAVENITLEEAYLAFMVNLGEDVSPTEEAA